MWMITGCSQGASSSSCLNYKPVAQLLSISLKSRTGRVKEACVQLSDGTGAGTMPVMFLWSECWCSFITPAGFGTQSRSAGCGMGQSCSTTQTDRQEGRKWRTRKAPQWDDLYSPQSLKFEHTNGWTNEAKGRGGGLVLDINSWRSAERYSVFLQGGRFTPGDCSCVAFKLSVRSEHLLQLPEAGTTLLRNECSLILLNDVIGSIGRVFSAYDNHHFC